MADLQEAEAAEAVVEAGDKKGIKSTTRRGFKGQG